MLRGKDDPSLFGRRDAGACATITRIATQTDFDEDKNFPVTANEVDFATPAMKIPGQYDKTLLFKKASRCILGESADHCARFARGIVVVH